jgi:two-component system NtrC family sensor kinase
MPRVLVVDDSLTVRMDLLGAFEASGIPAFGCATLAEARSLLAREKVALVILDVLLPDGDGVDLLREIRATPATAHTCVLMLSTEADVRDRIRGLTTGANEYVGKPYDVTYVVGRARELVQLARPVIAAQRTTVLVIDDSATFRNVLADVLAGAGYHVVSAETGEAGLRLAASARPSAIIVDGVLPGIDGATVIRRVRLDAALRTTPCILFTGSGVRDAELQALDAGADGFALKDEDLEVLLARLAAVLRGAPAAGATPGGATTSVLGPKKILAVDDSATYLQELGSVLRGEGYDVALARSGEEALELLAVQSVDCILLDVVMPGIGGRETCLRIKGSIVLRDIPLIMLTGYEDREAMIGGLVAGADDFISKTSDFEVLRARVRAQIRRKQFEAEARRIRDELLQREIEATEARAAKDLAEVKAALAGELEEKNRELEAFSYTVSHDLRAPLRAIDGFSLAVLEDYEGTLDERGAGYLRRIRAAAERMGELIDDLLALSKITRTEMRPELVDLTAVASTVVMDLRSREPGRVVGIEIADGLTCVADARLVRVLFENLLGNAWKFTANTTDPRIEIGREPSDDGDGFFVRDNGAGFDMAHAAKLFRPFQRLHTEAEFSGTGIGLATVHRIVDRHGGTLAAVGAPGLGATFRFSFPRSFGARARAGALTGRPQKDW